MGVWIAATAWFVASAQAFDPYQMRFGAAAELQVCLGGEDDRACQRAQKLVAGTPFADWNQEDSGLTGEDRQVWLALRCATREDGDACRTLANEVEKGTGTTHLRAALLRLRGCENDGEDTPCALAGVELGPTDR